MKTTYAQAINDGMIWAMTLDSSVVCIGQAVDSKAGVFGTTAGLAEQFGKHRVIDTPISEHGVTQMAAGMAQAGMRPVVVHQRVDFSLFALDSIINWIALWRFISNGKSTMPITIRMIVGKGWGQGPQHSKSLHSLFAHIPGLRVVVPGTPSDAKGLLLSSIFSDDPTIIIESRNLFSMTANIKAGAYYTKPEPTLIKAGGDVTVVAFGAMLPLAIEACDDMRQAGIGVDLIDLKCVAPLDMKAIIQSVDKTGRLIVCDPDWQDYGIASEIIAKVAEAGCEFKVEPERITWPQRYVGQSAAYEVEFYPTAAKIKSEIYKQMGHVNV